MAESQSSDGMKKLVTFLVALAVFGTLIALAVYFSVNLPAQTAAALNPPANGMYCQINIWGKMECWDRPGY
jgi:hypothetical protein